MAGDRRDGAQPIELLSRRQLEVLGLLARGLTNEDIAGVLAITPATVRTHVTAILGRLEVTNRTEAAVAFIEWSVRPSQIATMLRRPAIAVLPLVPLDDDPRTRGLARALTQELAALFSRWCWFPVITCAATIRSRTVEATSPALGQALGADLLVHGTLRVSPSAWRLVVRIDSAATGHCIWTERHDFAADALLAAQDAVCEAIVAAAYPVLIAHTQAAPRRAGEPHELQAWELAHEGMRLAGLREAHANARARSLFQAALGREADLVLAHYGLGLTGYADVLNQWSDANEARERLVASAERCVSLAPHAAEGHFLYARYFQTLGDHRLAARSLEAAIHRNPSFAAGHALLAQALQLTGRTDEAMARMSHAMRLGPGCFVAGLATLHFSRGEYAEALAAIGGAIAANPRYSYARALAAASAWWLGDRGRARAYARELRSNCPEFAPRGFLQTFGQIEAVERITAALEGLGIDCGA